MELTRPQIVIHSGTTSAYSYMQLVLASMSYEIIQPEGYEDFRELLLEQEDALFILDLGNLSPEQSEDLSLFLQQNALPPVILGISEKGHRTELSSLCTFVQTKESLNEKFLGIFFPLCGNA